MLVYRDYRKQSQKLSPKRRCIPSRQRCKGEKTGEGSVVEENIRGVLMFLFNAPLTLEILIALAKSNLKDNSPYLSSRRT